MLKPFSACKGVSFLDKSNVDVDASMGLLDPIDRVLSGWPQDTTYGEGSITRRVSHWFDQ